MAKKSRTAYLEGAEELDAALKRLGDRATGLLLREAVEKAAEPIVEAAKEKAPKRSGALAEGIHGEVTTSKQGQAILDISYNKKQYYGGMVERGTKHQAAQPFLRPAIEEQAEEAENELARYLWDMLSEVI